MQAKNPLKYISSIRKILAISEIHEWQSRISCNYRDKKKGKSFQIIFLKLFWPAKY